MKKYLSYIIAALILSSPMTARADMEFVQKIQHIAANVQQKAKVVQEKIEAYKNAVMDKVQAAQDMKSNVEKGVNAAKNGDMSELNKMKTTVEEMKDIDIKDNKGGARDAVQNTFVGKQGEGDSVEAKKEMDDFMQDVLRDSVSKLYAVAYATRANFAKETPRDVDMEATDQILMETNLKASKCVERMATVYILKSMVQSYNYIEAMQTIKVDNGQQEENDK